MCTYKGLSPFSLLICAQYWLWEAHRGHSPRTLSSASGAYSLPISYSSTTFKT